MGTVLVTGGQRGIGLGVAKAFTQSGRRVAILSETEDADVVGAALETLGATARHFRHDLRDVDAAPDVLDQIEAEMGPLATCVSNAGVPALDRGDMLDITPEAFDFVTDINLRGTFFLAQNVARRLLRAPADPYRAMIFVTSVSARMVSEKRAEYCISKAGASMMVSLFARRLAPDGVGVFEIQPGIIETSMTTAVHETYNARIAAGLVPARRWGQPQDIAQTVLALAEGRMAFSTGAVIPVDGGLSIPTL